MSDNDAKFTKLESIYKAIYNECESKLYYPPDDYQRIFQKIIHTSSTLFYSALRQLRRQNPLPNFNNKDLSIENIQALLLNIYNIIAGTDYPNVMEQKIKQLIKDYKLNPEELLIANPSDEKEYLRTQILLNETL